MELAGFGTLLLVFFVTLLVALWLRKRGHPATPPGPYPLPLLGNILQIDFKNLVNEFVQLGSRYGPVSMVYMGWRPTVVLNGYEAVKEALVDKGEIFSDRGKFAIVEMSLKGYGVVFSNGERWKQMRRFSLSTLRNFGMGKKSLEARVQEEAKCLAEEFQKKGGVPFDPTFLLSLSVSNVICSIVFNERFDYDDKNFLNIMELFQESFRIVTSPWAQIFGLAPNLLRHFPGPHHKAFKNFNKLREYVIEKIKIHEKTLDKNCPRDLIDCFLIKMEQEKDKTKTEFHYENLFATVINLFFAGTETTSTTLRYALLILLKFPDIRKKIRNEIDKVIGQSRCPTMEDKLKMPYTDAVINEMQRFADIVPLGLPHATNQDTTLSGFHIPKGTTVFPLLTSILKNEKYFKDPHKFDPGHFLDDAGNLKKSDVFMPFSIGKRVCIGEGLARMEIFLFITSILQMFDLKCNMEPEEIDISAVPNRGSNVPRPYMLYVNQC